LLLQAALADPGVRAALRPDYVSGDPRDADPEHRHGLSRVACQSELAAVAGPVQDVMWLNLGGGGAPSGNGSLAAANSDELHAAAAVATAAAIYFALKVGHTVCRRAPRRRGLASCVAFMRSHSFSAQPPSHWLGSRRRVPVGSLRARSCRLLDPVAGGEHVAALPTSRCFDAFTAHLGGAQGSSNSDTRVAPRQ